MVRLPMTYRSQYKVTSPLVTQSWPYDRQLNNKGEQYSCLTKESLIPKRVKEMRIFFHFRKSLNLLIEKDFRYSAKEYHMYSIIYCNQYHK